MEERQLIRVKPQHLNKRTPKTSFIAGTAVEVSLPDEHCLDASFPATVIKEIKNGFFLVQYSCLRLGGGANFLKDVVDALHIWPSPLANLHENRFDVLDQIDAFFGFGWWTGVVTEVLAGDRYIVQFEHHKKLRDFSQFELRPHFKWINFKDLHESQNSEVEDRKTDTAQLLCSSNTEGVSLADESDTRKRKVKDFVEEPCQKLQKTEGEGSLSLMEDPTPTCIQENSGNVIDCDSSSPSKVFDSAFSPLSMTTAEEGDSFKTQDQFLQRCASVQSPSHDTKSLGGDEINQQGADKQITTFLETEMQSKEVVSEASGVDPESRTPERDTADAIQTECMSKGTDITLSEGFSNTENLEPLSLCLEESHSVVSIDRGVSHERELADVAQTDCASEGTDTIMTSTFTNLEEAEPLGSCIASTDNRYSADNQLISKSNTEITSTDPSMKNHFKLQDHNNNLPFIKSSPLWENVESMEVFHSMPQNPHFQPLKQEEELLREGQAIGYMISFSNVVNATEKATLVEPKSSLEKLLDILVELEDIGFNVQPIRERLQEMIQVKESQLQLSEKLKNIKEEVLKRKHEEEELKLEANQVSEKLKKMEVSMNNLVKEKEKFVKEKESKWVSIAAFQERIYEVKKNAECAKLEFSRVAAEPW